MTCTPFARDVTDEVARNHGEEVGIIGVRHQPDLRDVLALRSA